MTRSALACTLSGVLLASALSTPTYALPYTTAPIPIFTDYELIVGTLGAATTSERYCLIDIRDPLNLQYIIPDDPAIDACPGTDDVQFFYTIRQTSNGKNTIRTIETRVRCVNSTTTVDQLACPAGLFNLDPGSVVCYAAEDREVGDFDPFDFKAKKCPPSKPLCQYCSFVSTVRQESRYEPYECQCCTAPDICTGQ